MDYRKVEEKYPDSLSKYNLHEELTNPKTFGPYDFAEIEELFKQMVENIYALEILDFRSNSKLYRKEIVDIEDARSTLNGQFHKISTFKLEGNPEAERRTIIDSIKSLNSGSQFCNIDNILTKLRFKELVDDPKGKELDTIVEAGKAHLKDVVQAKEDIDKIKGELKKAVEEAKKGTTEAGVYKSQLGTLEIATFFASQADEHRIGVLGNGKRWYNIFDGWLRKRGVFFVLISLFTLANIAIYLDLIDIFKSFQFTPEYGILSVSLLLILYVGLAFATNNYSVERQLEIENKNKANIAKTLELFLAGMKSEDISRSIVLQEASKTLFARPQVGFKKIAMHDASPAFTEITKIVRDVKSE